MDLEIIKIGIEAAVVSKSLQLGSSVKRIEGAIEGQRIRLVIVHAVTVVGIVIRIRLRGCNIPWPRRDVPFKDGRRWSFHAEVGGG